MNVQVAYRLALRELRGGVKQFWVLLLCLALGVAAIAAVTSLRENIALGLEREGRTILGGDAQITFTYRFANEAERAWIDGASETVSEIADFRSMVVGEAGRALTQVKAVDAAYPLTGSAVLDPAQPISRALSGQAGLPGIILDPLLSEQLEVEIGDPVTLGGVEFVYTAALLSEPDQAGGGFALGPRSIVARTALDGSALLQTGTLFDTSYRMILPEGTDLNAFAARAEAELPNAGYQWRDRRNAAPGISELITRLSAFLVLVGLAGLAVGGIGVSMAVKAYLDSKTAVIATLKTLGAERRVIFATYFIQIGILTTIGISIGLALGAVLPLIAIEVFGDILPVPVASGVQFGPLFEAALYGALAALIFMIWPLAAAERIRPAALYRNAVMGASAWPSKWYIAVIAAMLGLLVLSAGYFVQNYELVLWVFAGLAASFVVLALAALLLMRFAKGFLRLFNARGLMARLSVAALSGPKSEAIPVVLSLGLGLTVLTTIGQVDANLRTAIEDGLPEQAPSYFVVDIQPNQIEEFKQRLRKDESVSEFETAPMLRGLITKINGQNAAEVAGEHWVLEGDRGITYASTQPENYEITAGSWWPEGYSGPPQISFAAEEAAEMGLSLGDVLTVNVLGRDIEATLTSLREVDFSTAGMGFILAMNEQALAGAPHSHIATIYSDEASEARLMKSFSESYPNITMIRVRDAITRVSGLMQSIAGATTLAAVVTLITGGVVLIGAAAAGEAPRRYEASILKTLGAVRAKILASIAMRSLIMGFVAGGVSLLAGSVSAWLVITQVMDSEFALALNRAALIVVIGMALTLGASLLFAWRSMAVKPAGVLRDS